MACLFQIQCGQQMSMLSSIDVVNCHSLSCLLFFWVRPQKEPMTEFHLRNTNVPIKTLFSLDFQEATGKYKGKKSKGTLLLFNMMFAPKCNTPVNWIAELINNILQIDSIHQSALDQIFHCFIAWQSVNYYSYSAGHCNSGLCW